MDRAVPSNAWRIVQSGWTARPAMTGTSNAARIAPMRNVSQRPQPTFGPMNPTSTPPAAAYTR